MAIFSKPVRFLVTEFSTLLETLVDAALSAFDAVSTVSVVFPRSHSPCKRVRRNCEADLRPRLSYRPVVDVVVDDLDGDLAGPTGPEDFRL